MGRSFNIIKNVNISFRSFVGVQLRAFHPVFCEKKTSGFLSGFCLFTLSELVSNRKVHPGKLKAVLVFHPGFFGSKSGPFLDLRGL